MSQRAALLRPVPLLTPCEWVAKELLRGLLRLPPPKRSRTPSGNRPRIPPLVNAHCKKTRLN